MARCHSLKSGTQPSNLHELEDVWPALRSNRVRQCRRGSSRECVGSVRFRCQMVGRIRIGVIDFSNTTRPSTRLFGQLSPFLGKRDFLGKALFDATTALPQKSVK